MNKYIKGNVRKILYESNNGYKVGLFKIKETNDESMHEYLNKTITFTGSFMPLNMEVNYMFYGALVNHQRFGMQYNVVGYDVCEITNEDEIVSYLSSGLFKGIGVKTAKSIVDLFGENTIEEIKALNPLIYSVKGLSEEKVFNLRNKLNEYDSNQEIIISLNNIGFTTNESLNLINKYGSSLMNILESKIYSLKKDINFLKLDKIYLRNNEEDNPYRIKELIKYLIENLCYKTGDTIVSVESVYLELNNFVNELIELELFDSYISELETDMEIVSVNDKITLMEFYNTEKDIAYTVNLLNKIKSVFSVEKINKYISEYESDNNIKFNKEQKNAIKESLINNIHIITGGPGTGKTTIVKAIIDIYIRLCRVEDPDVIALIAPTGRSAKRLGESTDKKSSTIHKFLRWNKETNTFSINEMCKSKANLVIVDEMSMVDIFLFNSLLKGLKSTVKLILVGDANQLPPILPGNVLQDLLNVEKINHTTLESIYRAKNDSFIVELSSKIKEKHTFDNLSTTTYSDFSFIESEDARIKDYLIKIFNSVKEKNMKTENFQVLIPMYKGENGIDNINKIMQSVFNPPSEDKMEVTIGDVTYRENDKVMQLVNDIDNNIYNGDIGYIKKIINGKESYIEIDFNGNIVVFKKGKYEEFTHAYAITIHKSQGSEYNNVLIVLASSFKRMFYNKLIYTAVSRAKQSLILIGKLDNLNYAINTEEEITRETLLSKMF